MELRQLRYFASVVAHGSFSQAASYLHLTHPAVSRQVQNLEAEPSRDCPMDAWPCKAAGRGLAMATEPPDLQTLYAITCSSIHGSMWAGNANVNTPNFHNNSTESPQKMKATNLAMPVLVLWLMPRRSTASGEAHDGREPP